MNKNEFISRITAQVGVEARTCAVVEAVFEGIVAALEEGEQVKIAGLGTFKTRDAAARTGVNPRTGEPVPIPARKVPVLGWSQLAKDRVNPSK